MKTKTLLLILLCAGFFAGFTNRDPKGTYEDCFEVTSTETGKQCTESFKVRWKNTCNDIMDIKYALQKKDGSWSTGIRLNVSPGNTMGEGAYTCKATGKYKWWARPSAKKFEIKFPTDEEIKQDYNN